MGEFVSEEIAAGLVKGVIKEWTLEEPLVVINGLKVVDEKFPKLRLCIN